MTEYIYTYIWIPALALIALYFSGRIARAFLRHLLCSPEAQRRITSVPAPVTDSLCAVSLWSSFISLLVFPSCLFLTTLFLYMSLARLVLYFISHHPKRSVFVMLDSSFAFFPFLSLLHLSSSQASLSPSFDLPFSYVAHDHEGEVATPIKVVYICLNPIPFLVSPIHPVSPSLSVSCLFLYYSTSHLCTSTKKRRVLIVRL